MADTKISALSAGSALGGTEEIPIVQSSSTVKATPAQMKTYVTATPLAVVGNSTAGAEIRLPEDTDNGSNYVALKAPDTLGSNLTFTLPSADGSSGHVLQTNGSGVLSFAAASGGASAPLTLASGTLTSDSNALSITQTWNNAGVTFTGGLKINVTNSASASGSKLATFQIGGSDFFTFQNVSTAPRLYGDGSNPYLELSQSNGVRLAYSTTSVYLGGGPIRFISGGTNMLNAHTGGASMSVGQHFGFATGTTPSTNTDCDVGFVRSSAGVVKVTNGSTGSGTLLLAPVAVASLPSASSAGAGARHTVNDASGPTFGATVSGGGSTVVPVYSDGTNWKVG